MMKVLLCPHAYITLCTLQVVSNLPFNVSTEVVKQILPMGDVFSVMVLMLQVWISSIFPTNYVPILFRRYCLIGISCKINCIITVYILVLYFKSTTNFCFSVCFEHGNNFMHLLFSFYYYFRWTFCLISLSTGILVVVRCVILIIFNIYIDPWHL
jgi:hypothetical protein